MHSELYHSYFYCINKGKPLTFSLGTGISNNSHIWFLAGRILSTLSFLKNQEQRLTETPNLPKTSGN